MVGVEEASAARLKQVNREEVAGVRRREAGQTVKDLIGHRKEFPYYSTLSIK